MQVLIIQKGDRKVGVISEYKNQAKFDIAHPHGSHKRYLNSLPELELSEELKKLPAGTWVKAKTKYVGDKSDWTKTILVPVGEVAGEKEEISQEAKDRAANYMALKDPKNKTDLRAIIGNIIMNNNNPTAVEKIVSLCEDHYSSKPAEQPKTGEGEWLDVMGNALSKTCAIEVIGKNGHLYRGGYYVENDKVCIIFPNGEVRTYDIEEYFIRYRIL